MKSSHFALIALLTTSLTPSFALADEEKEMKEKFKEHKEHALHEIDAQMEILQKAKACMTTANDHEAMKECHHEREKGWKKLKSEQIEHQIDRLKEEKEKMKD